MRKLLSWAVLAAFVVGFSAAPLQAADKAAPDLDAQFKKLDANSDAKLSSEEFIAKRTGDKAEKAKEAFKRLDKNNDGSLSLEEFKARKKK
jgi:Ca2+-binding EF-hand superfamily protein